MLLLDHGEQLQLVLAAALRARARTGSSRPCADRAPASRRSSRRICASNCCCSRLASPGSGAIGFGLVVAHDLAGRRRQRRRGDAGLGLAAAGQVGLGDRLGLGGRLGGACVDQHHFQRRVLEHPVEVLPDRRCARPAPPHAARRRWPAPAASRSAARRAGAPTAARGRTSGEGFGGVKFLSMRRRSRCQAGVAAVPSAGGVSSSDVDGQRQRTGAGFFHLVGLLAGARAPAAGFVVERGHQAGVQVEREQVDAVHAHPHVRSAREGRRSRRP